MDADEFLFPRDLEVTQIDINSVLFIGSCLSEAYIDRLKRLRPHTKYEHILFNNAVNLPSKTADEVSAFTLQYIQLPLRSILTDAVIRIADNATAAEPADWIELGKRNIDQMLEKSLTYNQRFGILSLVSTFFVPQSHVAPSLKEYNSTNDIAFVVGELNNYLARSVSELPNVYLADVDMIANAIGKRFFRDDFIGFYTHSSFHYPEWTEGDRFDPVPKFGDIYENKIDEFCAAIYRQIEWIFRAVNQVDQVKVVIFDLDHTMWRGQLIEHYQQGMKWPHSHGWPLGIWEAVHHLRWRGIVTAIASKNDHELVVSRWGDAVDPPFVKFEDFIAPHINWNPKSENVASILAMLSLTPKSAVFVDDNPVERESVKAALPGIRAIGSNPFLTRRSLLWSAETQISSRTEETMRRERMLAKQIDRETEKIKLSREEFLAGLQCRLKLKELTTDADGSFTRVLELVNKTNQFNTISKRWNLADYRQFWSAGGRVFAFSVTDRYTEYGLTGVVFTKDEEIVQFVMSCRVLGMDVELAALSEIVNAIRSPSLEEVEGQIIETDVNTPCRDLFLRGGFEAMSERVGHFALPVGKRPNNPGHVTIDSSFF